jgi:hypothetical protein
MKLIFIANGCTFNKPTYSKAGDPNKIDAQIHFSIAYNRIVAQSNTPNTSLPGKFAYKAEGASSWTCYPAGNTVSDASMCNNTTVYYKETTTNPIQRHDGECINYRLFRCGDGIVNGRNGSTSYDNDPFTFTEQCDL